MAVQNGFAQAAQSWDAASGTYLPPSSGTDLSWEANNLFRDGKTTSHSEQSEESESLKR